MAKFKHRQPKFKKLNSCQNIKYSDKCICPGTAPSKSKNIFSRMNRQVPCNKHKPVDDGADSAAFYCAGHSIKFCVKSKSDQTRCGLQSKHGLGFSLNSHAPASRNGMRAAGVNTVSACGKNIKRGNPITRILCPRTLSKAGRKPYPNSDKLLSNVT